MPSPALAAYAEYYEYINSAGQEIRYPFPPTTVSGNLLIAIAQSSLACTWNQFRAPWGFTFRFQVGDRLGIYTRIATTSENLGGATGNQYYPNGTSPVGDAFFLRTVLRVSGNYSADSFISVAAGTGLTYPSASMEADSVYVAICGVDGTTTPPGVPPTFTSFAGFGKDDEGNGQMAIRISSKAFASAGSTGTITQANGAGTEYLAGFAIRSVAAPVASTPSTTEDDGDAFWALAMAEEEDAGPCSSPAFWNITRRQRVGQ